MNFNYNEWLLEDRLHIIDIVLIKDKHNFKIIPSKNIKRDIVLLSLLRKVADKYGKNHILNKDEEEIIVKSDFDIDCVKYKEQQIIEFNPLRVCGEEWIEWYINNFIKKE